MNEVWTPTAVAEAILSVVAGCFAIYLFAAMFFGLGQKDD